MSVSHSHDKKTRQQSASHPSVSTDSVSHPSLGSNGLPPPDKMIQKLVQKKGSKKNGPKTSPKNSPMVQESKSLVYILSYAT